MRAAGLVVALAALAAAPPARAQEPTPRPAVTDEQRAQAERSFEEGNARFHEGDYQAAIPLFRRAFELSGEPALLYNIAQAHRLAGQCRPAVAAYRRFLALAGEVELRSAAQAHLEQLDSACAVASPTVAVEVAPPPHARPAPGPWRTVGLVSVGAGVLAGAGAGALYLWNGSRYHDWQGEDRLLKDGRVPAAQALPRQEANDQLWRSIRRTDRTSLGLAIAAGVLVAGGTVFWVSSRPGDASVAVAFTGNSVAGQVRW
jgi:tetratricopeptide (TPR) repeat protein